mgnify:CR=1 FL=1
MPFSGLDRQAVWATKHETILVNTHKIQTVVVPIDYRVENCREGNRYQKIHLYDTQVAERNYFGITRGTQHSQQTVVIPPMLDITWRP